ncbi:hypothetical protein CW683_01240 [Macrococcoides caseolyticum]|nr:hypothetical protein CW683_01240 [Macrococcus caseolyticus]
MMNDNIKGSYQVYVYGDNKPIDANLIPMKILENEFRVTPLQSGLGIDYDEYKRDSLLFWIEDMMYTYPNDKIYVKFYEITTTKNLRRDVEYCVENFDINKLSFKLV